MRAAILGGTGKFGRALGARLRAAGVDVLIGSRDRERGAAAGAELGASGGSNEDIVSDCDIVVLAVEANAAVDTARELSAAIGSTPVLCVASELRFTKAGVRPGTEGESVAERVAAVVGAPVTAGLHSLAAANLAAEPADEDALVCGDDAPAKELALELAARLVGGRAVDAGPLASARALEGMTAVIVNVNRRYRAHVGIRFTGLH
jgi:8-hydroxy-5-deazaflavin:NADPH oxidoreductase